MAIVSLLLGILSLPFMFIGLIPCFGSINYLHLPFSGLGLLIAIYLYTRSDANAKNSMTRIALILNAALFIIGVLRLIVGGGIV